MKYRLTLALIFGLFNSLFPQNTAISLDGNAEYLVVDHKEAFDIEDSGHTIEAWIFANNWTSEIWRGSIVANDAQGPDRGFAFRCGNNGSLSFVMAVDNSWKDVDSAPIMNEKQWHHVAVTVGSGTMTLYIDGLAVNSSTYSGTISTNPTSDVFIGESAGFSGRLFDGLIDEVRIWDVVRTQQELADNITTQFTGSEAGLVAYFPMNDGSGNMATNAVDAACSASGVSIDDSNWMEGYSLPQVDLSVKTIGGIDRLNMKSRPVKPSVDIQNVGLESVNNYDLSLSVNGDLVVTETVDMEIAPGDVGRYTFNTPIIISDESSIELSVELSHPDDANSLNNTSSTTILNKSGLIVNVIDQVVHNFGTAGQTHSSNLILPGNLSEYDRILMHIDLDCPSGGCDPWDQTAKVTLNSDLGALEIARYITPYGIACGPWTVDVTDFKSLLIGENSYTSFIQVWGPSGWAVTLDLEFIEGNNPTPHSKMTPLLGEDYVVYGDPGISHDLTEVPISVSDNTQEHHVRMHVTGHGQGNTFNAAEFYQVTHKVQFDGMDVADHNLWKADCASNSCTNQAGTYLFSRAGWCPGQEVIPAIFPTTNFLSPGSSGSVDYQLQDYTNLLNTGYNSSGHTEPHYRIHSYFVEESSTPYVDFNNLAADNIEVTESIDEISITTTNTGTEIINGFTASYYINGNLEGSEQVDIEIMPGGTYTYAFQTVMELDPSQMGLVQIVGEVVADGDQSHGDNLTFTEVDLGTSTFDLNLLEAISVYPNPSNGIIQIEVNEDLIGVNLELSGIAGKTIRSQTISNAKTTLDNLPTGTLILKLTKADGNFATKKIVVID